MTEITETTKATVHTMRILGTRGHESLTWDPADSASTEVARQRFNTLVGQGYSAFARGERVATFDPQVEAIEFIPRTAGG